MLKKILLLLLAAAVLVLAACRNDEQPDDPVIETPPPYPDETAAPLETYSFTEENFPRMDGSPSTAPLAQAVAAVMLGQSRDEVAHRAMFTRTTQAFRSLAGGESDILIAGEPAPAALADISRQDFRYDMMPIAADALVFIVSKSNPVNNLTSEQVKAIYSGQITGWQQVGGNDINIAAYQRNEEATSQVLMERLVMDWDKMMDAPMQPLISEYFMYDEDNIPAAIKGFDGSINAIGYTMYHYAADMNMGQAYKILSIDGILPTPDTISGGVYPFISPYYAVINRDLPEDDSARILYNWLLSDTGQDFIASMGYVCARDAGMRTPETEPEPMKWSVVTDNTRLTPFDSPRSMFNVLNNSALPALEAYDGYGFLLPYSTAVTMNDGSMYVAKHGFVTAQNGIVVTDPVYDGIFRAAYSTPAGDFTLPVYSLHMNLPENDPSYGYVTQQAVCASDGSWITPFSYTSTVFRENIMFLMYAEGSFDIDVYDYDGNLLYNILDLEWAERIAENEWPEYMMYNEGGNFSFIQLDDGTYALVDLLGKSISETNFTGASAFSDGLCAVLPDDDSGLWGFVNSNLDFVIEPAYAREAVFIDGRAIVETPDGIVHVIDTNGNSLYSAQQGNIIIRLGDGHGYSVRSLSDALQPQLLRYDFTVIDYPQEVMPLGPESAVYYVDNGWFVCETERGNVLFNGLQSFSLPGHVQHVDRFIDEFVVYSGIDSDSGQAHTGVMKTDGSDVIAARSGQSVSIITPSGGSADVFFALNTVISGSEMFFFIGDTYERLVFSLADQNGNEIKSDLGIVSYDEASGFLYVQGTDYFGWLHTDGSTFISIPSMAYTFD